MTPFRHNLDFGLTAGLSGRASVNPPNLVKQIPTNIGEHYAVLHSS